MQSGVYRITNKLNGKMYVGSSKLVHERCEQHFYALSRGVHHNIHLQRAYARDGEASFAFDVLEFCGEDVTCVREQYWIDTLRACDDGYNIARDVVFFNRGVPHTTDARAKMSAARKGKPFTAEHIANNAAARTGLKRSAEFCAANSERMKLRAPSVQTVEGKARISAAHKGKIVSAETRAKMSKARKRRIHSPESNAKRSETMMRRNAEKRERYNGCAL
jgi:group I intron endonuclease